MSQIETLAEHVSKGMKVKVKKKIRNVRYIFINQMSIIVIQKGKILEKSKRLYIYISSKSYD